MFTVKDLFDRADLTDPQKAHHQKIFGRRLFYSYFNTTAGQFPEKTNQDGMEVRVYPEDFKTRAKRVLKKYFRQNKIAMKKRKRI